MRKTLLLLLLLPLVCWGQTQAFLSGINSTTSGTSATITWTSIVPASSQINFGTSAAYTSTTTRDATLVTNHSVSISGLNAGTTYHYQVTSADANGNAAASADFTFTTAAATPPPTSGGVSFVQGATNTNDGSSTTIAQSFAKATTAGDLLVAIVTYDVSNGTSVTFSDSQANVWKQATFGVDTRHNQSLGIFYAENAKGGTDTITARFAGADAWRRLIILEYSGILNSGSLDAVVQNNAGSGTAVTSGSATTSVAGDLVIGAMMDDHDSSSGNTISAGSGFTMQGTAASSSTLAAESQVRSAAGTGAATFSLSGSADWLCAQAAFKPASSSSTTPPPPAVTLSSITVSPSTKTISSGATQQFTASGRYSDGSSKDITTAVTWSSSNTSAATISNSSGSQGLATAVAAGSTTLTATQGSVSGSAALTVSSNTSGGGAGFVDHSGYNADLNLALWGAVANVKCVTANVPGPGGAQAGALLTAGVEFGTSGSVVSVTDDHGNTWNAGPATASSNGQFLSMFYASNVAAGTRQVQVCFDQPTAYVAFSVDQFYNVATANVVDGAGDAQTGTNNAPTNHVTTAAAGDLVVQYAIAPNLPIQSWKTGTGYHPIVLNNQSGFAAQYSVTSTTGTQTASLTFSGSPNWAATAMAFKAGSGGALPAGIRVVRAEQYFFGSPGGSLSIQFPTTGNLTAFGYTSGNDSISSVADTNNNTWKQASTGVYGTSGLAYMYYAASAAASDNNTITVTGSGGTDASFTVYDIAGASNSPLDTTGASPYSGNQSSYGNLTADPSNPIVPSGANELVLIVTSIQSNSVTGVSSPSTAMLDPQGQAQTNGSGGIQGLDAWGHGYTTGATPFTWVWTTDQSEQSGGVNNWVTLMAAFK